MDENVAKTIPEWEKLMAEEAKNTNANITISFEMPDGGQFILKYKLPKKGGK